MAKLDDLTRVEVDSRKSWRRWLTQHHGQADAIWLVTWKKPDPRWLSNDDVVEEALCFGWIDSLPRKLDETRTMLLLTPRKAKSAWSAVNKARVARMIEQGKMTSAGLAIIETAKASGMWEKLDQIEALEQPDDLRQAFARNKTAAKNFDAFPRSAKRGILEWIVQAKRPDTRAARIAETVEKAAQNIRANQWRL